MTWVEEARATPVAEVASRLGLLVRMRRAGPCPCCGEARGKGDRRPPLVVGRAWWCVLCNAKGDGLDLVAWKLAGKPAKEAWSEVRAWFGGDQEPRPRPVAPTPPRPEENERGFPDATALRAVLASACSPGASGPASAWLASRGIPVATAPCGVLDWRRPPAGGWPAFWPQRWAFEDRWPVVMPAFDATGRLRSLHGRAVLSTAPRKTTWPAGCEAAGLMFLSPVARKVMRGLAEAQRVIVVEGVPDYLHMAATCADPVIGVVSGGWSSVAAVALPKDLPMVVLAHADQAGARYAAEVTAAVAGRRELLFSPSYLWPAFTSRRVTT